MIIESNRIAVSNIAWPNDQNEKFFKIIKNSGASGVELAASIIWPEPIDATPKERREFRKLVEEAGLSVIGLHALLFSRPDLQLLSTGEEKTRVINYLKKTIDLCAELGGHSLVLGGPKNRQRGNLPVSEAIQRAITTLIEVGQYAASRDCFFSLEALPIPACDFITNLKESDELCRQIPSNGVKLHFDTGAASITDWSTSDEWLTTYLSRIGHCQINNYDLLPPNYEGNKFHSRWSKLLENANYHGWLSIEMRRSETPEITLQESIQFVNSTYNLERPPS